MVVPPRLAGGPVRKGWDFESRLETVALRAFTWSMKTLDFPANSVPNSAGGAPITLVSSSISGRRALLRSEVTFTLLVWVTCALALPSSSTATLVALITSPWSNLSPLLPPSRMEVRGARASRIRVCTFANSLSTFLVADETSGFIKLSNWGVLVAATLGRGYRLRRVSLSLLGILLVQACSRKNLVWSDTSTSPLG